MTVNKFLLILIFLTSCDMHNMEQPTPKKIPYELILLPVKLRNFA